MAIASGVAGRARISIGLLVLVSRIRPAGGPPSPPESFQPLQPFQQFEQIQLVELLQLVEQFPPAALVQIVAIVQIVHVATPGFRYTSQGENCCF